MPTHHVSYRTLLGSECSPLESALRLLTGRSLLFQSAIVSDLELVQEWAYHQSTSTAR